MEKRIIKFRGKRVDNGEWVYGDLFRSHPEHHSPSVSIATEEFHPVGYGSRTFYEVDPESVGQFVGLLDKSGKEIYEGDVVRILYTDWPSKSENDPRTVDQYLTDIANVRVVVWSYNGFYVSSEIGGYAESMEHGKYGYIEVIGNVYENSELLTP